MTLENCKSNFFTCKHKIFTVNYATTRSNQLLFTFFKIFVTSTTTDSVAG